METTTTLINNQTGEIFIVEATFDEIGVMSKAKLNNALIPIAEQERNERILSLEINIQALREETTDEILLDWARSESPLIDELAQLELELDNIMDYGI